MFHQLGEQMRMVLRSTAPFVTKITVIVRQNFTADDGVFTSTSTGFKQCLVNPFPFSKSREEFEILRNRSGVRTASTALPTMLRVHGFCTYCSPMLSHRSSMLPPGPWTVPGFWPAGLRVSMSSSVALCILMVWFVSVPHLLLITAVLFSVVLLWPRSRKPSLSIAFGT